MTKLWDSVKNKTKTLYELAKEFPEKTYRELEKYRDADRREEAQQVFTQQENEELKREQKYKKEHKLRQEAETETILVKGIGMNSPEMKSLRSEVAALKQQLHTDRNEHQNELDRVKRENNDLHNKVAALLDAVNPDENLQKARESGM